ncbi:MAG: aquaporin family protein [Betaproteobacteria bacterium]|nr:aquaporin family protein [Betaproteobacteria bacterium]NBT75660.1 aquaporin family protein [Betaproteobacteria bacterium]NCA15822.1 aquaporin family protein [Betaproteobacteria bacterium]
MTTSRRLFAEGIGSALLLCVVIGSGLMAEKLSGGNNGVALIANTLATVWALYVLITILGPVSGAHFNPVVSLVMAMRGALSPSLLAPYIFVQIIGAVIGAWLAHLMFDLEIVQFSTKTRTGLGIWTGEIVATAGLILVILNSPKKRVAGLVASFIGAAYWFTSSTSFANPAAAIGRMMTESFAGISPADVPGYVAAELAGALLGLLIHRVLVGAR